MEVVITSDEGEAGRLGADVVTELLRRRPDAVIGVATGSSPLAIYDELGRRIDAGELSLKHARAFMLDEYIGLPPDHPERYHQVIHRDFVAKVDIEPRHVHGPDGSAQDVPAACAAYERAIAEAGGIDVQILGVGTDGHIAFNEPGSSLVSRTRLKTLTERTRLDNSRFFDGDADAVPRHCITQGLGTIMDARAVVLVAQGAGKADAVAAMVEGPITAMVPGSILQMHPHATVVVDEAAAAGLKLAEYYRLTYDSKPQWQRYENGL